MSPGSLLLFCLSVFTNNSIRWVKVITESWKSSGDLTENALSDTKQSFVKCIWISSSVLALNKGAQRQLVDMYCISSLCSNSFCLLIFLSLSITWKSLQWDNILQETRQYNSWYCYVLWHFPLLPDIRYTLMIFNYFCTLILCLFLHFLFFLIPAFDILLKKKIPASLLFSSKTEVSSTVKQKQLLGYKPLITDTYFNIGFQNADPSNVHQQITTKLLNFK